LKNGWSAIGKKAASTSPAVFLFISPFFFHQKTQERGGIPSASVRFSNLRGGSTIFAGRGFRVCATTTVFRQGTALAVP
jgi:hypothetical protein